MLSYIFFARWFGIVSVILALGILFNLDDAKVMARRMIEEESGYIMGGVLPIVFGTFGFLHLHIFQIGWKLVVTLVGLFMMLVGAYRVLLVDHWKNLMRRHLDHITPLFSLFGLMLGIILIYIGFFSELMDKL